MAPIAAFALMMKARADDWRIFASGVQPHVLAIQDSKGLDAQQITEALNVPILKTQLLPSEYLFEELEEERAPLFSRKNLLVKGDIAQADVAQLIGLFEHGKTFGSLIRVPVELAKKLPTIAERVQDVLAYGGMFEQAVVKSLEMLIEQGRILADRHSVTDISTIPGELFAKFQTSFYADPRDAVFKALGVE